MKILALSLLRLGDFFHQVHLLRDLSRRHPAAEIHVLIFADSKIAVSLFPEFHFHILPRQEMQQELVERHRSWRRAVYLLRQKVTALNSENFSTIYNLTHTAFSARLMDALVASDKHGLQFVEGKAQVATQALKYVNDVWALEPEPLFNWVDATALSAELNEPPLMPTPARRKSGEIWLQPLTSDLKKNWEIPKWRELAARLRNQNVAYRFISAPGEGPVLSTVLGEAVTEIKFSEIREQKENCALLVCGDTSVLHFAVLEEIPVLGLYIGPANPYKTPPRQVGAGIWWSHVPCAPCAHRSGCSQSTQRCSEALSVDQVELSILANRKEIEFGANLSNEQASFGEVNSFGRLRLRRTRVGSEDERNRRISTRGSESA